MQEELQRSTRRSRRAFLGSVAVGTVAVAGCLSYSGDEGSEQTPVRGDPDADITLEVYEDFVCPHCQDYNQNTFPMVQEEYLDPGLIRYEHRDFPFLSSVSWQATSAVREVYDEHGNDLFWTYKSELMARGGTIQNSAPDIFGVVAAELDIDADPIQSAATDRSHDSAAEADKERGESLGVEGTPSFVVDGELMDGLQEALQRIDEQV